MEIKLKDNNDDLIITRGGVSIRVFDFLFSLVIPVEGDVQIFDDAACTKYATGVKSRGDKVYARINTPWGFGEGWGVDQPESSSIYCLGPNEESPEDSYAINLWFIFTSNDYEQPFTAGQVIELRCPSATDITNYQKVFTGPLQGTKILCKYNVTDTNTATTLLYSANNISSMKIDGIEQQSITTSYTFDTTGEHTVLFTLSEGVTSIGDSTFYNCKKLTTVTIGNSITSIGSSVFYGCSGLTNITIGNSVTSIGNYAFYNCRGRTYIAVDSNNQTYDSRNNCNAIIETSTNKLILGCKNTIIPDSVTSIGSSAFSYCSGLTSITIPDSVTSIGSNAFAYCSGLTNVTIPNSVTSIGDGAFCGCSSLTSSITIPNSVTSIGIDTFYNCSKLTSITIPDSVTSIGINAFSGCSGLTSITIPNSVTSIGGQAFQSCSGLANITIGNSVTSIADQAFYYCTGLTSITCNATKAPTIKSGTFRNVKTGGTLTVPAGSNYDVWMLTGNYYLGKYKWTKVEQ